jgi:type IV fimbrial biogenesis protein FimT
MKNIHGYSIIELLSTLVLASLLLAVGIPKLSVYFDSNRMVSNFNNMISAIQIARSEAIKRGARVTMCKSANADAGSPVCTTSGGWEQGWIVFEDSAGDADYSSATDVILRRQAGVDGAETTISANAALINDYVMFTSRGIPKTTTGGAQSGVFRICDSRGATNVSGNVVARGIVLNAAGRVRKTTNATVMGGCP